MAAAAVATAIALAWAPARAGAAETGINVAINQTVDGPAQARHLRVGWARLFVGWSSAEPQRGRYDQFYLANLRRQVSGFRARGIKVLLVVSGTPAWAAGRFGFGLAGPRDPGDYGRFAGELVRLVPGIGAIEVWNEADEGTFWAGAPDPAGYAALLRAAYGAIKAQNRNVTVVTTGMVGNNYGFLSDVYAAGGGGAFDAVGVHTDTACLITSPALYYREVHHVMAAHGDASKGIWMTEIGWNTGSQAPNSCRDGAVAGTRAEGVSERTQAGFLRLAYRCLAADRYVRVALWFSLQDVGHGAGYGDHLGLIRTNGRPKPAYTAMRNLRNGRAARPARCGGPADHVGPSIAVRTPRDGAAIKQGKAMPVRVRARDNRGGTGVRRIDLLVDGQRVRTWLGGRIADYYWGFRGLGLGPHRVVFRARDFATNVTERALTVRKVR